MLATKLIELENLLRTIHPDFLSKMQEGLPTGMVSTLLRESEIHNDTLVELYKWKNGNRPDLKENVIERLELFPEGIMLSIQEALAAQEHYTKIDFCWTSNLFPIFANGGGNYLLLDILSASETGGMVLLYDPVPMDSENITTIYDSAVIMFESIIECVRCGAYKYLENGTIDLDFDLRHQVCSALNPKSLYWK